MKKNTLRSQLAIVLIFATNIAAFGQSASGPRIDERNVRAAMNFLASDAMQGRGSGTVFERIAAEYIGSQFMQFGLEPAGENGWDGKPGYVQTVSITRNSFASAPVIKYGSESAEHGKEMVVIRMNSERVAGSLQKVNLGEKASAGSAVLLRAPADAAPQAMSQGIQALLAAGATIVMVEETPQYRSNWSSIAGRRLGFTASTAKPAATVVVSKEAAAKIAGLPDGTPIDLSGQLAPVQASYTWNAIGKLTGSDPALSSEVVVLGSHLDHVGVRENAQGDDKIFNGADDDASGTVAVMELARAFAKGPRPKRTVYFVCFGSEEAGGFGSGYFAENLPFAKEKFIANLQFEMIGRPDSKVKPEELWLTGYERSDLGPELAKRGAKLVQDPHPQENFFQRSDNYTLARRGIIAHTVSSFGLHPDYHRASDELDTIDFSHMTKAISSMVKPIDWLLNSNFRPAWMEGKRP
jgi:aminopeptidase YwaD